MSTRAYNGKELMSHLKEAQNYFYFVCQLEYSLMTSFDFPGC